MIRETGPAFFLLLLVLPAAAVFAEDISSGTLRLEAAIQYARENNPEIKSAKQKWLAAKERVIQAGNLPDPGVSYEDDTGLKMNAYGVSQEFPFFGKLSLRAGIARHGADVVRSGAYVSKELEIVSRVKTAYYMLLSAEKAVGIYQENAEIMRNFVKVAEAKYIGGQASQSDVLRSQVELSKMLNMLVISRQERESGRAMLNILLNRNPRESLGFPAEPEKISFALSSEELEKTALENRPELLSAKQSVERNKSVVTLAKTEYLPDFMLAYKKQYDRDTGSFAGNFGMVSLNLPLWFWKQGAMVREAGQELGMSESEYTAMKNMTYYDVKNLFTKVQAYQQLVNQYKTVIMPQAQQNLDVSLAGYRSDKLGFLELLDSQRTLLNLRLEYYQYLAEYEKNISELERVVGTELKQ